MSLLSNKSTVEKAKNIAFNMGFYFLSGIPLVCSALDIIYLVTGIIGMTSILVTLVFLNNGRKKWDWDMYDSNEGGTLNTYLRLSFSWSTVSKK